MTTKPALTESKPDFKKLVEGGTDVIWSAEIDGTITYLSPQFKTLFGLEPQDWIGRTPHELVHPNDANALTESIHQQNGNRERVSLEFRHLCHDGSYIWVGVNAIPIFDDDGEMLCRQGTTRDISVRKQMEQEQARLLKILQTTSDFVGICHPETGILWQNEPFRKLRPDLDIVSQDCPISELYPKWAGEIVESEGKPMAVQHGVWSGETALLDSVGNEIPTSQVIIAHKSDAGEVEYYSTILRDISQIKATEHALRDAQSELRGMTENVPGVISRVVHRPDGSSSLSYISPRVRELFGIDPEALKANMDECWKRVHPDDVGRLKQVIAQCIETLEPYHVNYRLVHEEKGTRLVEAWSLPSRLDNGDTVFDGVVIDVTDLGRLDSLQREINFKQIFNNAPDAVFLIIADGEQKGRIVAANNAAECMHGYDAGELNSKKTVDLVAPADARDATDRLKRLAEGETLRFEVNHTHRDGSVFPAEVTASRILIEGRPYVLAFARDLTERKKAETERIDLENQLLQNQKLAAELDLTKTQSRLSRMAENVPGVVYQHVLRADGTRAFTYISAKCREMFGVEHKEILEDAQAFWKWIEPEDHQPTKDKAAHSAKTLERYAHEFRVVVPGRGVRWCSVVAQPERQPNGDLIWDGVVLDVTDRREVELANEALAKATKTKDQFLANMSHELRTPLSAILGMTEGLKQGIYGETTERQMKTLGVVEESGLHLLELINEILDLATIETGNMSLSVSNVDVERLCKTCLDLVSPQATQKQIKLSFNADWNLTTLQADETRLRQILINLLGNAIKFTPDGGEVKLEVKRHSSATKPKSETLRFSVIDNGIGIEPNRVDALFQPFVQIDSSFTREYPGTGLGLSLVKRFVELHSGTIDVQSEPGKGSRFTVELPYSKQESQIVAVHDADVSTDLPASGESDTDVLPLILLAEDNEHVAMALNSILEASGFRVLRAVDGKVAVQSTREHSPDLILMDVQMPVMDGLEAIRQIRSLAEFGATPIIASSGFAMPKDSNRCIEAGADMFLGKPFRMPDLISEIRQLISSRKSV